MVPVRNEMDLIDDAPRGELDVTYIRAICNDCRTRKGASRVIGRGRYGGVTALADVNLMAMEHDGTVHDGKGDVIVKATVRAH